MDDMKCKCGADGRYTQIGEVGNVWTCGKRGCIKDRPLIASKAEPGKKITMGIAFELAKSRVSELEALLMDVEKDLLIRADTDPEDGGNIINISASIWSRIKRATEQI